MPERIQQILNRIVEWWKNLTNKQRIIIVSIATAVVVAFVILGVAMTRPVMRELRQCETAKEATTVKELLESENISYTVSTDGMTYSVEEKDYANASILLGTNDIPSSGYGIENVFDGSFSTTEADKKKKYQRYLEEEFSKNLSMISNISAAKVTLSLPEDDGTMAAEKEEAFASVILTLSAEMDDEQAAGIAKYIATELGNKTTNNITILDDDGNVRFAGGDETTSAGMASANLTAKQKTEANISQKVKSVILGTNVYDNAEVSMKLAMDFSQSETTDYRYYVEDGREEGYLDSRTEITSENNSGNAGVPGTDTNDDDTTYVLENGENSNSNTSEINEDYLPNETITNTKGEVGTIAYDESSITVVATTNVIYKEDALKASGALDDMTFDEFVEQNSERVKMEVDEDFYTMVANATGFPIENITIVAYEIPNFLPSTGSGRDLTDYLQIVLAVLIFAMLGYVVFRSTRKAPEEEVEEELSVQALLESTREEELEDIGFTEKSEARVLIEKFVDEKPEAVAALLRNWLNDDWG